MTYQFDGYNWLLRLDRGEKLLATLIQFVKDQQVGGAWVSGLGAAAWAEIGYYNLESKEYQWRKFDQLLEITSLEGNVAWDGLEPVIHLHGNFSDDKMQAYGGHVKELEVGGTCEVLLHRWYKDKLVRSQDPVTGLKLLSI